MKVNFYEKMHLFPFPFLSDFTQLGQQKISSKVAWTKVLMGIKKLSSNNHIKC